MGRQHNLMSASPIRFKKSGSINAGLFEGILRQFGLQNALTIHAAKSFFNLFKPRGSAPSSQAELPLFVVKIRRLFAAQQIRDYPDHLEQNKSSPLSPGSEPSRTRQL